MVCFLRPSCACEAIAWYAYCKGSNTTCGQHSTAKHTTVLASHVTQSTGSRKKQALSCLKVVTLLVHPDRAKHHRTGLLPSSALLTQVCTSNLLLYLRSRSKDAIVTQSKKQHVASHTREFTKTNCLKLVLLLPSSALRNLVTVHPTSNKRIGSPSTEVGSTAKHLAIAVQSN